jgi:hypothetical protein
MALSGHPFAAAEYLARSDSGDMLSGEGGIRVSFGCPLMAHHVVSLLRDNQVVFGAKQTSTGPNRIHEYTT